MPRGISRYDEARLQQRLWTPALIPKAQFLAWHDFTDLSTLSTTGGLVDSARDKSGNGVTVSNTGASRPTLSMTALNGRSAGLVFNNFQSLLATVSWTFSAISAFVVLQSTASSQYLRLLSLQASASLDYAGGNGMAILRAVGTVNEATSLYYTGDTGITPSAGPSGASAGYAVSHIHDGAHSTGFMNGVAGTTSANTLTTPVSPTIYEIGMDTGGGFGFVGTISETILLPIAAPSWLRQKIEGYLFHKHKIPAVFLSPPNTGTTLCGNHPYWSSPPLIGG